MNHPNSEKYTHYIHFNFEGPLEFGYNSLILIHPVYVLSNEKNYHLVFIRHMNIDLVSKPYQDAYSHFFLNQQFITRHAEVDRGSYFVTTYRRTKLHGGRRNDKKEEMIKQGTN